MAKTKVGLLTWLNGPMDEFEEVGEHIKDVEVGTNPLGKLNPRNLVLGSMLSKEQGAPFSTLVVVAPVSSVP
jgi:hypothetical protein